MPTGGARTELGKSHAQDEACNQKISPGEFPDTKPKTRFYN
jgi:hypothetical protein